MEIPKKLKVIADPVHGPILYTTIEHEILSSRVFNRLHNILQNSMAYYVYPSTRTSRFVHSIGVMHLATVMFTNGCLNADPDDLTEFLEELYSEFKEILRKVNIKNKIDEKILDKIGFQRSAPFRERLQRLNEDDTLKIVGKRLQEERVLRNVALPLSESLLPIYYVSLQSLRLLGLLHDCGHLPFSHVMEFALESLWDKLEEKTGLNELEENVRVILDNYCSVKEVKIHEILALEIMEYIFYSEIVRDKILNEIEDPTLNDARASNILNQIISYAVLCELTKAAFSRYKDFTALRAIYEIVSSDLDADRLDFASRDGKISGLLGSTGDVNRIIKFLNLLKLDKPKQFHFMPSIQTLNDIEQVLTDRFIIYKYLVCHHKVIRFDYLIEKAVSLLIELEMNSRASEGKTEIEERINIGNDILQLIDVLNKNRNLEGRMYRLSQIDDFWLMNVLRGKYFELLVTPRGNLSENESRLLFLLDEIFTGSRKLKSLWKRDHQFFDFIEKVLSEKGDKIAQLLENLQRLYPEFGNIENILQRIREFDNQDKKDRRDTCVRFMELLDLAVKLKKDWLQTFVIKFEKSIQDTIGCENLCAGTMHKLRTGIKDLKLYAYSKDDRLQIVDIRDVSNIPQHLDNVRKDSTRFVIYSPYRLSQVVNQLIDIFVDIIEKELLYSRSG